VLLPLREFAGQELLPTIRSARCARRPAKATFSISTATPANTSRPAPGEAISEYSEDGPEGLRSAFEPGLA